MMGARASLFFFSGFGFGLGGAQAEAFLRARVGQKRLRSGLGVWRARAALGGLDGIGLGHEVARQKPGSQPSRQGWVKPN